MTRARTATILATGLLGAVLGATPALAQRSLFDQPIQNPTESPAPEPAAPVAAPVAPPSPAPTVQAAPAEPAAEEAAEPQPQAKPRPRKPRGPVPARSLVVTNGSPIGLVALEVSQDGRGASLKAPLAPGKKITLRLPAFKGCEVNVVVTFEGGQPDTHQVDICKEKTLNFKG